MHIELFREICLSLKGVEETFPFGEDVLVYKVLGKIFALTSFSGHDSCNLKCNPDYAIELRSEYSAVQPGYHMNKQHWNTITYNLDLPDALLRDLIKHSYDLVVASLPKKQQQLLATL
ncbi:MAG: MmcQ/YjbR family DNA-binding protein [Bacteroidota bacterium]